MAYDPWAGYNEGMQGLGQTFDVLSARRRQENLDKIAQDRQKTIDEMAAERFKEEKAGWEREKKTREGLASIYDLSNQTRTEEYQAPNPEFTFEMEQGPVPPTIPQTLSATRTVPVYSPEEIQRKAADFLASKGDWTALKGLENSMDITSKIDERSQKMLTNMLGSIVQMRKAGMDTKSIKLMLKQQAENLNRISGKVVFDTNMVDNIDINAAGDLVTQDIGGGQKAIMITQPNGMVTVHVVDTTKQQRVNNTGRQLDISEERIRQGWARLNPRLQAELEASKAAGKEESKAIIKAKDDYYNAQDAVTLLDEAEAILNKDPSNVAGITAKFRGLLGSIDPAIEQAIGSGDRKTFERLMTNNADTFKKLLGPQISNADANLMFKLSGATAASEAEIRAAIKVLRQRNNREIRTFEQRRGSTGSAAPATRPYTSTEPPAPKRGQQSPPAYNKNTHKLQSRTVNGVVEYRVVPK